MSLSPDDDLTIVLKALADYAGGLVDNVSESAQQRLAQTNDLITRLAAHGNGRFAIIPLPEPADVDPEGVAYWGDVHGGGFVSARGSRPDDQLVDLSGVCMGHAFHTSFMRTDRALQVAGWLVAGSIHVNLTGK